MMMTTTLDSAPLSVIDKRIIFLVEGDRLSVKLSYREGKLTGTETYYASPPASYWEDNYSEGVPIMVSISGDVGFRHEDGFFLLWQNDTIHATELVGFEALHMPETIYDLSGQNDPLDMVIE
jgi:hypothetical protein